MSTIVCGQGGSPIFAAARAATTEDLPWRDREVQVVYRAKVAALVDLRQIEGVDDAAGRLGATLRGKSRVLVLRLGSFSVVLKPEPQCRPTQA